MILAAVIVGLIASKLAGPVAGLYAVGLLVLGMLSYDQANNRGMFK
jgi:hypothetical protein